MKSKTLFTVIVTLKEESPTVLLSAVVTMRAFDQSDSEQVELPPPNETNELCNSLFTSPLCVFYAPLPPAPPSSDLSQQLESWQELCVCVCPHNYVFMSFLFLAVFNCGSERNKHLNHSFPAAGNS